MHGLHACMSVTCILLSCHDYHVMNTIVTIVVIVVLIAILYL